MRDIVLVFDLDDTLYKEIDFLKSAYREIAHVISVKTDVNSSIIEGELFDFYENGLNAFDEILKKYKISDLVVKDLVVIYRNHKPSITLSDEVTNMLVRLKGELFKIGLITDGRSVQQRNKLKALKLDDYFDDIIISEEFGSEKPNMKNFKYFSDKYGENFLYVYVGDNTNKDFIAPNNLGWLSICLEDDGRNIHKQDFSMENFRLPKFVLKDLLMLESTIFNI